ncbi:MAG: CBS domain-containing protein [Sorangiineae bacterium]|nr:CBS domain-containing protein [Polyangiaceae bacterium]MEB2324617.1 CBS domain-containing protein [Sorangiineae bacterium]
MDAIVTHELTDFDGFAAATAARMLYPGAVVVVGRQLGAPLAEFMALHKERFPALPVNLLDQEAVTRLVLVDCRRASRLHEFARLLARAAAGEVEVHVYDHHGAAEDDVPAALEVVERVGSATTLLVEALRARGLAVDEAEATLFSLGIHADTGSLSYAGSTARDAAALGWLLGRGVNLTVQGRYLRRALDAPQRALLSRLLGAVERRRIRGLELGFTLVALPRAFAGFAQVVSELAALEGAAALFALFVIDGKRTQIIARSATPACDVGRVLAALGGGGHPAAAAAVVRHGDGEAARARIVALLGELVVEPRLVRDVMSSPVLTVAPEASLEELRASLDAWRVTGAPVVEGGRVLGIISRRDVERAARAGDLGLPVKSRMRRAVVVTTPATPLPDALTLMQDEDVGRLPVIRDGRLVGILTRSDALAVLYEAG